MSALIILIGTSIIVAIGFLIAFIWNVKAGQYEDDFTPSVRMLFDNNTILEKNQKDTPDNNLTRNKTTTITNNQTTNNIQ